jgi:hypothetical protein
MEKVMDSQGMCSPMVAMHAPREGLRSDEIVLDGKEQQYVHSHGAWSGAMKNRFCKMGVSIDEFRIRFRMQLPCKILVMKSRYRNVHCRCP